MRSALMSSTLQRYAPIPSPASEYHVKPLPLRLCRAVLRCTSHSNALHQPWRGLQQLLALRDPMST